MIHSIPELYVQANNVVLSLMLGFLEGHSSNPAVWHSWAFYMGVGAVYWWDIDWDTLKRVGIYETIEPKRGLNYVDEYVQEDILHMSGQIYH